MPSKDQNSWVLEKRGPCLDEETGSGAAGRASLGSSTPTSLLKQVSYLKQTGLGGVMVWTLDMDNFAGFFCNQGRYPLIKTLRLELSEYGARAPQVLASSEEMILPQYCDFPNFTPRS